MLLPMALAGDWVRRHLVAVILVTLFATAALAQTVRIEGFKFGHVKVWVVDFWIVNVTGLEEVVAARDETIAKMIRDQEEATRLQAKLNKDTFDANDRTAHEADNRAEDRRRSLTPAADRYARANRLRKDKDGSFSSDPAPANPAPEDHDRPSQGPEYVAVLRDDYDILIENTLRLMSINEYSHQMIDDGRAVLATEIAAQPPVEVPVDAASEATGPTEAPESAEPVQP